MCGTALKAWDRPHFCDRREQKHLVSARAWNGADRYVLVFVHVLRLVRVIPIVHRIALEKKVRPQFSRSNHLQKNPAVEKPSLEKKIKLKLNKTTASTFNKIKMSWCPKRVHHSYCGNAPSWPSLTSVFRVLALGSCPSSFPAFFPALIILPRSIPLRPTAENAAPYEQHISFRIVSAST